MPSDSVDDEGKPKDKDEEIDRLRDNRRPKRKSDLEVPLSALARRDSRSDAYERNDNNGNVNDFRRGNVEDQTSQIGLDTSPVASTLQLHITKSVAGEPFGIVIQGGIDAPYIDKNGEEKTQMRVKEIKSGGAAARQKALKDGMEVRRVNNVDVRRKTHREIAELIRTCGNELNLDVITRKSERDTSDVSTAVVTEEDKDDINENNHFFASPAIRTGNDNDNENNRVLALAAVRTGNDNENNHVLVSTAPSVDPARDPNSGDLEDDIRSNARDGTVKSSTKSIVASLDDRDADDRDADDRDADDRDADDRDADNRDEKNEADREERSEAERRRRREAAREAEREADREAERAHVATNAAIVRAADAANAANVAVKNADIEAAREEIERKLVQLQRLRDSLPPESRTEFADSADSAESAGSADTAESAGSAESAESADSAAVDVDVSENATPYETPRETPPNNASRPSPRSNIMWGAVATHLMEPSTLTPPTARDSSSCSPTPSPYHIPTPSPLPFHPRRQSAVDQDPAPHLRDCDTPYPICFPRLPSGGAEEEDRKTPAPPQIRVKEVVKEAVEKTPFERPLTAWSIHDPTEEDKGRGGGGGAGGKRTSSQTSLLSSDNYASKSDYSGASEFDVSKLDPHSEAAKCKWRPLTSEPSRNRKAASKSSARPRTPPSSSPPSPSSPRRRDDQLYLFVGSLTLLAASAMIGLIFKRHY